MAQTTTQDLRLLFERAGLDYNQVRAMGFDTWQMAEIQKGLESGIEVTGYLNPDMPWTEMEEFRLELEQGVDLSAYRSRGFTNDRLVQIREGMAQGVDVSVYAKQEYFAEQMKEIREGLAKGLPVMFYKDPAYNYMQMAEIRQGLEQNVDISKYAQTSVPYQKMHVIREAMASGVYLDDSVLERYQAGVIRQIAFAKKANINLMEYAEAGYDDEQLEQIRRALADHVKDFVRYINRQYRGESMREIRLGLAEGVDVTHYASLEYSWQQMREIRLGLEARVNTRIYEKPLYLAQQMREIRKGLEEGLDVSYYTSMVYSSREMRLRRRALLGLKKNRSEHRDVNSALNAVGQGVNTSDVQVETAEMTFEQKVKAGNPFITVSDDGLKADLYIPFKVGQQEYTMEMISRILSDQGIIYGIDYNAAADLIEKKLYNRNVTIANGLPAKPGKDGWYDFFFDTRVPSQPATMPDLSLLYDDCRFFEPVTVGKKLAEYHEAEFGGEGRTVRGDVIAPVKGKELPILKGRGIMVMDDRKSWCASLTGEIRLRDYEIEVRPLTVVENAREAKAVYEYPGSVQITGNVTKGVTVKARGDIVVQGRIDGARLDTDGSVYVVGGCLGMAERSLIRAGGRVWAPFIRNTDIRAGENVQTNELLDSNVTVGGRINIAGQSGTVSGGEIQAQMGLSCAILGNTSGKRTIVQLGASGELTAKYQLCLKNLSRVESELGLLRNERDRVNGQANNAIKTQNQIKIGQALTIKEKEENALNEERADLERQMRSVTGAKARITRVAHAGSIIIIDGIVRQLTTDMANSKGLLFKRDGGARVSTSRDIASEILGLSDDDE